MGKQRIAVIGGDGIGPEVIEQAAAVLEGYAARGLPLELWRLDLGAERYLRDGTTLPRDVFETIAADCAGVLLGALGDARVPGFEHAREILFGLRFGLDLYANVRPLTAVSDWLVPLKGRGARDVNVVVFRENTEGIYAGIGGQLRRGTADEVAINEDINTRKGVERILVAAFEHARRTGRRLHMADKSNAMRHAHELWLRVFEDVRRRYPDVHAEHIYVDALCTALIMTPERFGVIVTNNLFGDIVSDLGAALVGGTGMAPSASLHPAAAGRPGVFEPVHGTAPDLAGRGVADPFAAILSAALLLGELGYPEQQHAVERAVASAVDAGRCTADVGGSLGTAEAGAAVRHLLFG